MAFSPPEYCRLFAQKKAYQGGVTGTPGPPSSYAPDDHITLNTTIYYVTKQQIDNRKSIQEPTTTVLLHKLSCKP